MIARHMGCAINQYAECISVINSPGTWQKMMKNQQYNYTGTVLLYRPNNHMG